MNYPAILLGKLAVDKQWRGLGRLLVERALLISFDTSKKIACKLVFLHVQFIRNKEGELVENTNLISYYENIGFTKIPPGSKQRRTVLFFPFEDLCESI